MIFSILLNETIHCGILLELPRRGDSNGCHNERFNRKVKKNFDCYEFTTKIIHLLESRNIMNTKI